VSDDLARPDELRAAAVLCHPHPAYGGDRHNPVIEALYRTLPGIGVAALRFDFGPAAAARGGDGAARAEVTAALDRLAAGVGEVPVWLVGYSFGADVALAVDDPRHRGWVAVAPPMAYGGSPAPGRGDGRPVLVLVPEHDRFSSPEAARAATSTWPDATVEVIPMADHFLAGAAGTVADRAAAWLAARL
jgi:alpha/beta superfamily hydrolase